MVKIGKKDLVRPMLLIFASVVVVLYLSGALVLSESNSTSVSSASVVAPVLKVTQLGNIGAEGIGNGVLFNGNLLFWRTVNATDFAITEFNLGSGTFTDIWNSNCSITGSPGDIKVINGTVYASYGFASPEFGLFNTTIIDSSDLKNWATYCFSGTVSAESLAEYTGPGPYSGMLEYGGYSGNTFASIRAWNSTSNQEIDVFDGTPLGSDDCCFMTMFNSTCMIVGDCAPSNIIYTNDGGNWTDEYSPDYSPAYTPTYPFAWGWSVYVDNGTAYAAEESSAWQETGGLAPIYQGGVMTWSGVGTTKACDYNNELMETISYKLVGGCSGLFSPTGTYDGFPVIYQYNPDGSKGPLVWEGDVNGTVKDLTYMPESGAWYAIAYSNSNTASILKVSEIPPGISCNVSSPNLVLGDSVAISGSISPAVSGTNVTLSYTMPNGSILIRTVTSTSNGSYSDTYTPSVAGSWSVSSSWQGNSAYAGASSTPTAFLVSEIATNLSCFVSPSDSAIGGDITVSGAVNPPMSGIDVTLNYTGPNGTTQTRTVTTSSNGSYSESYVPEATGSWSVTASWGGDPQHPGAISQTVSFNVQPAVNYTLYGVVIAAAILCIAIGVAIKSGKKKNFNERFKSHKSS